VTIGLAGATLAQTAATATTAPAAPLEPVLTELTIDIGLAAEMIARS
jgi:hypothetical protein